MRLKKNNQGFTLIELMVAVSIFVIVALIVSGAIVTVNQINKKAQAIKLAIDNVDFALQGLTLKLSQGGLYQCLTTAYTTPPSDNLNPSPIPCAGGEGIFFQQGETSTGPINHVYQLRNERIEYWSSGMSFFVPITRADIQIADFVVRVSNSQSSTPTRPRVVLAVRGQTTAGGRTTEFAVETAAVERR